MTPVGGCVIAVVEISRDQAEPLLSSIAPRLRGVCLPAP